MLTIEQLKSLKIGDYVWLIQPHILPDCPNGHYISKVDCSNNDNEFFCFGYTRKFLYEDYGKTWIAYKNKEEAEGKSITLPYLLCTSRQFACVIWRDTDGKVKKTHTYPMYEAKAILREKEQLVCKP